MPVNPELLEAFNSALGDVETPAEKQVKGGPRIDELGGWETLAVRAKAALPSTEKDQLAYLESVFGEGQVEMRDGTPFVQGQSFDAPVVTSGNKVDAVKAALKESAYDLVEAFPEGAQMIASMLGGIGGGLLGSIGGPLGTVAGATAGAAATEFDMAQRRDKLAGMLGMPRAASEGEKLGEAGSRAAWAAGGEAVLGPLAGAAGKLATKAAGKAGLPKAGRALREALEMPGTPAKEAQARAAEEAAESVGVKATMPADAMIDDPGAARKLAEYRSSAPVESSRALHQTQRDLMEALDRLAPQVREGSDAAARQFSATLSKGKKDLIEARSQEVGKVFDRARGTDVAVPGTHTQKLLQEIIEEEGKALGDLPKALVRQFEQIATQMRADMPIDVLQERMKQFGRVAAGSQKFLRDVPAEMQETYGKRLLGALYKDLDKAAESGVEGAEILKEARDAWKAASRKLDDYELDAVKKILKIPQSATVPKIASILTGAGDEATRTVMKVASKTSPKATQELRGAILRNLVEAGQAGAAKAGTVEGATNPLASLIHNPKKKAMMDAVFVGDPDLLNRARSIIGGMIQLRNAGSRGGSAGMEFLHALRLNGPTAATRVAAGLTEASLRKMGGREGAEVVAALSTRQGTKDLKSLVRLLKRPGYNTRMKTQVVRLLHRLGSQHFTEEGTDEL